MGWSITIGSIAGTAIRIHITFLLFLVWIFGASYASGGSERRLDQRDLHPAASSCACWPTNSATSSPRASSAS